LIARAGLSQTWLEIGDAAKVRAEASVFSESARSTLNPYLQTQACEMKSQIAIAGETGVQDTLFWKNLMFSQRLGESMQPVWDLFLHANDC
jgi:hypothetical protein